MKAYIKRSSDFKTVLMGTAESWSLPVASADGDTGQLALAEYAPAEHTGNWVYVLGQIYRIAQATPSNNQFTATLADPATAFDRQAIWPDAPETTYGAFIKAALERDYLNCADAAYKVPYLQITNTDTTALAVPELDDTKLYRLSDIITTARAAGVRIRFGIDGDKLAVDISTGTGTEHNILFTDGRAQLETESYSADTTAKVTVLQAQEKAEDADKDAPTEYVAHTFYLSADGEITETAPTDRAEGKWAYITCKADETPADKAAEVFAANANSYKIEFYSSRRYALYDRVRLRLHGAVFATRITGITLKSGDDRYLYRCGELATTIQQKVKKSLSASSTRTSGGGAGMSLQSVYPVGAVYISTSDTNPETLFGFGTWERIKDRFLLAAGDAYAAGATGGEATHQLTIAEMPYHQHQMVNGNNGGYDYSGWTKSTIVLSDATKGWAGNANTSYAGESASHNNMPPYLAVYMWRRTA